MNLGERVRIKETGIYDALFPSYIGSQTARLTIYIIIIIIIF